jgi:tetratricopeptide repeat protein
LHNLAAITNRQGDLAPAETLYRRALAIKEYVLGHDHPEDFVEADHPVLSAAKNTAPPFLGPFDNATRRDQKPRHGRSGRFRLPSRASARPVTGT